MNKKTKNIFNLIQSFQVIPVLICLALTATGCDQLKKDKNCDKENCQSAEPGPGPDPIPINTIKYSVSHIGNFNYILKNYIYNSDDSKKWGQNLYWKLMAEGRLLFQQVISDSSIPRTEKTNLEISLSGEFNHQTNCSSQSENAIQKNIFDIENTTELNFCSKKKVFNYYFFQNDKWQSTNLKFSDLEWEFLLFLTQQLHKSIQNIKIITAELNSPPRYVCLALRNPNPNSSLELIWVFDRNSQTVNYASVDYVVPSECNPSVKYFEESNKIRKLINQIEGVIENKIHLFEFEINPKT